MQQQQQTTATTNAKPTPMLYISQTVTNYTILLTLFNLPPILKQLGCFLSLYSFNFQDTSALLVPLYLQPGVGQYSSSQSLAEELLSLAGQLDKKSLCTSMKLGESSSGQPPLLIMFSQISSGGLWSGKNFLKEKVSGQNNASFGLRRLGKGLQHPECADMTSYHPHYRVSPFHSQKHGGLGVWFPNQQSHTH